MGVKMFSVSCGECGHKKCTCARKIVAFSSPQSRLPAAPPGVDYQELTHDPNPDPSRFTFVKLHSERGLTLAQIKYYGCTNYEGMKILLLRKSVADVVALSSLDPHFLENDGNGLLARFVPTSEGWDLGLKVLKSIL